MIGVDRHNIVVFRNRPVRAKFAICGVMNWVFFTKPAKVLFVYVLFKEYRLRRIKRFKRKTPWVAPRFGIVSIAERFLVSCCLGHEPSSFIVYSER